MEPSTILQSYQALSLRKGKENNGTDKKKQPTPKFPSSEARTILLKGNDDRANSLYVSAVGDLIPVCKTTVFTLSIGTPYLLTVLLLKFETVHSTTS